VYQEREIGSDGCCLDGKRITTSWQKRSTGHGLAVDIGTTTMLGTSAISQVAKSLHGIDDEPSGDLWET